MINWLIQFSLRQRLLIVIMVLVVVGIGIRSMKSLPIDAFPDVTPTMVQIVTESEGLAPEEVERLITYPVEVSINGIPGVKQVKSISAFGLSMVSVYFKDNIDIYFARQLILEKLQKAKEEIPQGLGEPEMGPITTGLGQVYQYVVEGKGKDLTELRSIQDWIVKFNLRTVPGVTEILSFGGKVKQYQVQINPDLLRKYDIHLNEVINALKANNANVGGSFIEKNSEEYLVRGLGWVKDIEDLRRIVIGTNEQTPIYLKDVANIQFGPEIRRGAVSRNGNGEIVTGIVLKLIRENTAEVIKAVKEKVSQINKILPEGVKIVPFYDQADLVAKCIETVRDALIIGIVLVVIILFLFLGNVRTALIVTAILPLSCLVAFTLMKIGGFSANLMSLGGLAIGIGMMVDGGVVMVENIYRHLSEHNGNDESVIHVVLRAAQEMGKPIVFAIGIIVIVFLPIFTFEGVEGKLFTPMAFTISFAMLGSLIFSLTVVPVLCAFFLKKGGSEHEPKIVSWIRQRYIPLLNSALNNRKRVITIASACLIGSLLLIPFLGTEFVPVLDEGTFMVRATMAPSTSLNEAIAISGKIEKLLLGFPEVKNAISRVGRAEIGGDPEPVNNVEIFVDVKPQKEWKTAHSRDEFIKKLEEKISQYPGISLNISQPIAIRVDELISGVKAQLAINLFGDDLDILVQKGNEIAKIIQSIRGAADVQTEQVTGQPQLVIAIDREKIARYGINVADVQEIIRTAIGGEAAGEVFEGQKRFNIFVRLQESFRNDVKAIGNLLVHAPVGGEIPLAQLADIKILTGPKQISRDDNQRRIVIQANIRGRDMGGFVSEAQQRIEKQVKLPTGYFVTWGGQFENQQRAMKRLMLIVPVTIAIIFFLLFLSFNSLKNASLIILNVPFSMVGGIVALWISRLYLSVPASVGFIALFGVAVLNGVVLVTCINQLRQEGTPLNEAITQGCMLRLRPVLMTALVASLGLVPLLFSTGTGSEVQKPLATVVVGGLFTSTILTLLVLPVLYGWFQKDEEEYQ
ncbi:MAG TPA: efflux RND transporter permease subunit [Candidatus Omnitrophota bacterium]|nr:efflux RND transporter permease subunit [Candidatus Omnitrophota bacterium]